MSRSMFWFSGSTTPGEIARELNNNMTWDYTPQKGDFWRAVYGELQRLQDVLDGSPYTPSSEYERFLRLVKHNVINPTPSVVGGSSQAPVSSGTAYRCIDCSLLRCAAPDNRCPECDANINGP